MNRIGIYVSQDMIDAGVRKSSQSCPIALGLKTMFNGEAGISRYSGFFTIETQRAFVEELLVRRFKLIPLEDTAAFIKAFDTEQPVEPGVYHVDIWQESDHHEDLSSPEKSHPGSI